MLPHDLHGPVTLAALAAGKHVSVQKPMALDLAQASSMIAAAHAHGRVLRVFENAIFYPPVQLAKQLIADGAIGEPLTIRIKANKGDPSNAWAVPAAARS